MSKKNDFPTVEELSAGFSEFRLEQSEELAVQSPEQAAALQIEGYTLVSPRKGIYLLDYIESHAKALSVTIAAVYAGYLHYCEEHGRTRDALISMCGAGLKSDH